MFTNQDQIKIPLMTIFSFHWAVDLEVIMNLILKIKKAETPFHALIKKVLLSLYKMNIPVNRALFRILYGIRIIVINIFKIIKNKLWDVPVFKSICKEYGNNLILYHGIPHINGDVEISIGNDVSFYESRIEAYEKADSCPQLKIGNNVVIGPGSIFKIKNIISIGNDCLIGANNLIIDYYEFADADYLADIDKQKNYFVEIEENVWTGRNVSI